MLEQKLREKYVAHSDEDIASYIGKRQKLIILKRPLDKIPQGYTQVTMAYKGEQHLFLIPEKAKFFMANPGEDGNALDALDEIADFYQECSDFEHELMYGGSFSVMQSNVSTLARNSYAVWAINQIVRQKKGSETPEWNNEELSRLGIDDDYVNDRLRAIAAIITGKTAGNLKEAGLEDILVHKTAKGEFKEMLSEEEFDKIACWAGSHYELRGQYQGKGYDVERRHDTGHKKGWKISNEKEFFNLPGIGQLEKEIEEHRQKQGKQITRHDKALLRTVANLRYIIEDDPAKQLDVIEDA